MTAVVDPTEAGPVESALSERGWQLTHILNTHHHWDHTGGNLSLKSRHNAKVAQIHVFFVIFFMLNIAYALPPSAQVVGPAEDKDRIPGIDIALSDGATWQLGSHTVHVLHTPGHTRGMYLNK